MFFIHLAYKFFLQGGTCRSRRLPELCRAQSRRLRYSCSFSCCLSQLLIVRRTSTRHSSSAAVVQTFYSNVKYLFPLTHSSCISETTAVTNLSQEASFGNSLATLVRRLISPLSLSTILTVLICFQCFLGR